MGLDTSSPTTLWKDRAVIELNAAVLYSFQVFHNENNYYLDLPILFKCMFYCLEKKHTVTIVDHHTATESFMT